MAYLQINMEKYDVDLENTIILISDFQIFVYI